MSMTMYMYLGHISFSFKNFKKVILKNSLGYDLGLSHDQILRNQCLLFTTCTYKEMDLQNIYSLLYHFLSFLFRVIRERKDNWDPWDYL